MAITKEKKANIVRSLVDQISRAVSVVFVNFHGLSVGGATELRRSLREQNVGLTVAKKTLIRRAFSESKVDGELPELPGEIALAFGTDAVAPARGIHQFGQKHKDLVKIVGGVYEARFASAAFMSELAVIPSREVLLGKLANILNSPIQRLVLALDQISKLKANS